MNTNTGVGTESKVMVGLERKTVAGSDTGVGMVVGMDMKSAADMSGSGCGGECGS